MLIRWGITIDLSWSEYFSVFLTKYFEILLSAQQTTGTQKQSRHISPEGRQAENSQHSESPYQVKNWQSTVRAHLSCRRCLCAYENREENEPEFTPMLTRTRSSQRGISLNISLLSNYQPERRGGGGRRR